MFKGLKHLSKALELLSTALEHMFQALEHKIVGAGKYFPTPNNIKSQAFNRYFFPFGGY